MRPHIPVAVFLLSCTALLTGAEKLTPAELLKRHLAQLPATALHPDRMRAVRGPCIVTTPAKTAEQLGGSFDLTSTGESSKLTMQFQSDLYEGESFSATGNDVEIGFGQRRTTSRSALGIFVGMNKVIVGEGLIGGVLNARWPLADPATRQAKLSYDGMKKFAGRDMHRIKYRAKQGQGLLDIYLYFEPETFRHAGSVYTSSQAQSMGFTPESSSRNTETYFRLEETFSDFAESNGLTLPRTWTIRYERTGDSTTEWKYELKIQTIAEPGTKEAN